MNANTLKPKLKYSKRLAAGTITSAISLASASGAVVTTQVNQVVPDFETVSFTPTTGAFTSTYDTNYMGAIRNCFLSLLSFNPNFEWAVGTLTPNTTVDGTLTYQAGDQYLSSPAEGVTVFGGFRVLNQGAGNDETHYGYAMVTGGSSNSFTYDSFSYETSPNTGIVTAVPEVSTLTLGILAVGTFFWRRRRPA